MQEFEFKSFLSRFSDNVDEIEIFDIEEELPPIKDTEGVWIAGGSIRRTLRQEPLSSDVDIFFKSREVLESYRDELKKKQATELHKNEHQESYSLKVGKKDYIIQLIKIGYYEDVKALLGSFDFTITQFAYDGEKLYCGDYSLWDLARNRLALHKLTYGVASMRRMLKYTNQGFTACAGTMRSILDAVVENPAVIQSDVEYVD